MDVVIMLVLFAALTLLFFWFFLHGILLLIQQANNPSRRRKPRIRRPRLQYLLVMIILPLFLSVAFASGLVVNIIRVYKNDISDPFPPPTESIPLPVDPGPVFPTVPPVSKEEDLFQPFRLSAVENSIMLMLDKEFIGDAAIDAGQLAIAADERFGAYIAQYCRLVSFFPFYPDISAFFPAGKEVDYSFDSVSSLDECNAQMRGIGKRLEHCKVTGSLERIGEICHHLAIRSRDALNFAKYQETENQQDRSIWLYSEISFSALINEYIYNQPEGLALSDWYYRTAQVFDYLGGIADTEELELRMYFLSAVFLRCSFETLKEQGLQVYSNAYDYEIWSLYVEMLYRVSTHTNPAETEGFYLEIRQVETIVLEQPLPDTIIAHTTKTLNSLVLYQEWRAQYG